MLAKNKNSIGIVVSSEDELILLENFRESRFSIQVFLMDDIPTTKIDHTLPFDFFLFQQHINMPGYMREVEDRLEKVDLVVLFNDCTMAAFQAARVCEKSHKDLFVLYLKTYFRGYEKFRNIRVIRDLVQKVSNRYITPNLVFKNNLIAEGLEAKKIKMARFSTKAIDFSPEKASKKFRKYIGISEEETVFACFASFKTSLQLEVLVDSFAAFLASQEEDRQKLYRLIFVGSGEQAMSLKKRCVDQGLSTRVAFLEQDISAFKGDLISALDVSIFPESLDDPSKPATCPEDTAWDSANLGKLTIIGHENAFGSMLSLQVPKLTSWDEFSLTNLFAVCEQILSNKHLSFTIKQDYEREAIHYLQESLEGQSATVERKEEIISTLEKPDYSLETLEKMINDPETSSKEFLWACTKKAEVLRGQGDLDGASIALGMAIQEDNKDPKVFVELGKVSLEGGAFDEAIIFFKQAYGIDSNMSEALFGIGQSHLKVGLFFEALYWFEKAVVLDPTNKVFTGTLAHTCLRVADKKRAIETLENTLNFIGDASSLNLALGKLYLSIDQSEKGHSLIEKGLKAS